MVTFQQAYDAVAARYSDNLWTSLPPIEITRAIYQEMRRLDAEYIAATAEGDASPAWGAPPAAPIG
jgi:hypothetical protein